jgi:polyisoprenoid-binding protein YceI
MRNPVILKRSFGPRILPIRFRGWLRRFRPYLFLPTLVVLQVQHAHAATPWNLPAALDSKNTSVGLTVETGEQVLKGSAASVSGKVWLADAADPRSIRADIRIPTESFRTGSSGSEQKLRLILMAMQSPEVRLIVDGVRGDCRPENVPCSGEMYGRIAVQGLNHALRLPYHIRHEGKRYRIRGESALSLDVLADSGPLGLIFGTIRRVRAHFELLL